MPLQNADIAARVVSSAYVLEGDAFALHGATEKLTRDSSLRQRALGMASPIFLRRWRSVRMVSRRAKEGADLQ